MSRPLLLALLLSAAIAPLCLGASAATTPAMKPADGVLLQADEVIYDNDSQTVSAQGHVEIDDNGRMLMADKVTYDQNSDKVTANGHVKVIDEKGNVAFADHVILTDRMRDGVLGGFGALIGKNGRLAAASAQRVGARLTIAHHAAYTPCKICNQPGQRTPVWQVKAERMVYDQEKHEIRFNNATFEVFGVPVAYTPYLTEPDPTVKYAMGFLTPDVGNSTNIGYFVRAPLYIPLSTTNDVTIAPLVSSKGGEVIEAEYRERWDHGGMWLQGSGAYNPNGGLTGNQTQTYGHLFGSGRIGIDTTWTAGYDVQLSSNDTYLKRYDISQLDRLVNDLYVEGTSGRSRFAITGYYFQGLRATDNADVFPAILPLIEYSYIPTHDVAGGQFRFDVDTAVIERKDGPDSQRLTGELRWQLPFTLAGGQLLNLRADVRGDVYHVTNNDPLNFPTIAANDQYISRGIPYGELEWRWPFISNGNHGRAYIIEPIVQAIVQPYGGNPAGIPNEDATAFEFDENNLFSENQLPGYDLVESGPRANVGVRAEAIFPTGTLEALLGQTLRLKPDPIFAVDSGEAGSTSDIVGRFSAKFPHLDVTDLIDVDRGNGTVRRHELYVTGTYNRSSLQISYVQLPPEAVTLGLGSREELNTQADINFYDNYQAFAAIRRDLIANQFLDTEYGLGYEDECLALSIAYRRRYTTDRDLPPSTSVILRFSLKTGDSPIEPFSLFPRDVFAAVRN